MVSVTSKVNNFISKSLISVMKPSVVTATSFPPNLWILCKHSAITLLTTAFVTKTKVVLET